MVKSAAKRTDTSSKLRPASIQTEIKSPGDFINAISNKVSNSDSTPFLCALLSTQNSHCLFWRSIPTGRIRHKRKHNIPKRAIPHLNYHLHQQIAKFCPIFSIFIFRSACCLVLLAKSGRIDNTSGFIYSNSARFPELQASTIRLIVRLPTAPWNTCCDTGPKHCWNRPTHSVLAEQN